ncbi:MAG: COX15/CtaA family protein [Limisphaerales bacterium]
MHSAAPAFHRPLHWFAVVVTLATLGLISIGGLVTSHGVGMAVPDWPTSFGYNMFALPFSLWLTGGVFHEHTHRLWASVVGLLVVALMRWLGGAPSRRPLLIIGGVEIALGLALPLLNAELRGMGFFLAGMGGVILLAGLVWVRNAPAARPVVVLGWWVFWLVQLQGLLGGLRVILDAHHWLGARLGVVFGVFHGCLGQVFLVLVAAIALMTSAWWLRRESAPRPAVPGANRLGWLLAGTTAVVLLQLLIGATMRHQHAGLAIWDFPLAHGRWWPDLSAEAIARYNAQRVEIKAFAPITAFQVVLQMIHRIVAVVILALIALCFWQWRRADGPDAAARRWGKLWLALVLVQAGLGAWTVWSHKAADIATLHVIFGAATLVTGALMTIMAFRFNFRCCGAD